MGRWSRGGQVWWMWAAAAMAEDLPSCSPGDEIRAALSAWLQHDPGQVTAALARAEDAFGCSAPVDAAVLARYWLVEGALRASEGDREAASEDFAAARRVAPDVWLTDLGAANRALWEAAQSPQGIGSIDLSPELGARALWIDGVAIDPAKVAAGLHLVQIGGLAPAQSALFASVIWVDPGVLVLVESGLPPIPLPTPETPLVAETPAPTKITPPPQPPAEPKPKVTLHALVGGGGAVGEELSSGELREPSVKIAAPLEIGVGVRFAPVFARLQFGSALLLGGRYLAQGPEGTLSPPWRADAALAAGGVAGPLEIGLSGGISWPSRLTSRLVFGVTPVKHLRVELRPGINQPTERPLEPAGELLVGLSL